MAVSACVMMVDRLASPFRGKPATTTGGGRVDNSSIAAAAPSGRLERSHQTPNYVQQQHQLLQPAGMPPPSWHLCHLCIELVNFTCMCICVLDVLCTFVFFSFYVKAVACL